MTRPCFFCEEPMRIRPLAPHQKYCGSPECLRAKWRATYRRKAGNPELSCSKCGGDVVGRSAGRGESPLCAGCNVRAWKSVARWLEGKEIPVERGEALALARELGLSRGALYQRVSRLRRAQQCSA